MKELFEKINQVYKNNLVTISGFNEGEKYLFPYLYQNISKNEKIVVVSHSKFAIDNYKQQLEGLGKNVVVLEDKIPLMYSLNETKSNFFKSNLLGLSKISKNDFDILLLTPQILFQRFPNKESILKNIIYLKKSKIFNFNELIEKLINCGYSRQEVLSEIGEFSVHGDTIDIFAINYENPIRISFFDDEIEKMNFFDINSFKTINEVDDIEIFSNTFLFLNQINKNEIKKEVKLNIEKLNLSAEYMLRISEIENNQFEYLENDLKNTSNVFFLPFCNYFGSSIFDFLDNNVRIIVDEPKLIFDKINEIEEENISSFLDLSIKGEVLPKTIEFYNKKEIVLSNFNKFKKIAFARLISQNKIFNNDFVLNFICSNIVKYHNNYYNLTEDCRNLIKNKNTILISFGFEETLKNIKENFDNSKINYVEINEFNEIKQNCVNIINKNIPFSCNFQMEKFILIGSLALNKQILNSNVLNINEFKPKFLPKVGDYVVHEIHGVGKCLGIKNLKITSANRDYIIIEYKDGDILYLPCENADMLSAFVGEDNPKCNKIGGTEFFKVKQRVKASIKEMAFDLIKVYSQRFNSKGFKYSPDTNLQSDFESSFVYPYTSDQINAVKEIKNDMESGKIMDRLLCGDVGFGKTEVALAIAFKAVQDGKQVAFISPTTILSEQHYNTTLSRMKNFMVNVEVINRFKTKAEQTEILNNLKDGKIDIICGTHRLFSKDVVFKDLGLVVLDEEQRFGVEDKERLKNLKKTVDVLSLSATPIPRTLYMSLVGIRDVSFLTSAPINRKKIQTNVIDYSDSILVECCKKELNRGGQVLIIFNRVEGIVNFYNHVKNLLPEAKIAYAHGQMTSKELENVIYDLYTQKTQILISTVLIENGVDLPLANTLFVIDSDKLGLSQLYQLRGRIGRSDIEAYSYFSFKKNKMLSIDAYKRLDAVMEFNDLGSGYKLAVRDLEIRGAGDVLGSNQHGHMQKVGYDMYVKLLNEAVKEIKGEKTEKLVETKIDISLNACIPENYIETNDRRISLYTKISKIKNMDELNNILDETREIYGNVPEPTKQLFFVGLIKNMAQRVYVKNIIINSDACKIIFYPEILQDEIFEILEKPSVDYALNLEKNPIIVFRKSNLILESQKRVISFLTNLIKNKKF